MSLSSTLDYNRQKQKVTSSSQERIIYSSTNGGSFNPDKVTEIVIPGNMDKTFLDFHSSYLRFDVTNNDPVTDPVAPLKIGVTGGAYNLIQKIEFLSGSGQTLSTIENYNLLINMLSDMQLGNQYRREAGNVLAGMNVGSSTTALTTTDIAQAGGTKTFCLPLKATPFYNSNKYFPLFSRDQIRMRIHWASTTRAFVSPAATASEVVYSPVEFVAQTIRIENDEVFKALVDSVGGVFRIVTNDYRNASTSVDNASTTITSNLGFSNISLNRVLFGFYPDLTTEAADSNAGRDFHNLKQFNMAINGRSMPARKIQCSSTNVAEPYAELLNAMNALGDITHQGSLNVVKSYSSSDTANDQDNTLSSFIGAVNLESMREHGAADSIYSGVNTIGSVVQLELEQSAAGQQANLEVFGDFSVVYNLDMNGMNTWDMIN